MNQIYVTGDTHGVFDWLPEWCEDNHTTKDDKLIILGDAGILFYGAKNKKEIRTKELISSCPITLWCVRGNHEARPQSRQGMKHIKIGEGKRDIMFYEPSYPTIYYAQDGAVMTLENGKRFLFIGGAYSIDKDYRLIMKWPWFEDEELSYREMTEILDKVSGQSFDCVFTHTCPLSWQPYDKMIPGLDRSKISQRMEVFLENISNSISFRHWFFGHYHGNRTMKALGEKNAEVYMLFERIINITDY